MRIEDIGFARRCCRSNISAFAGQLEDSTEYSNKIGRVSDGISSA
jgi:hypothetical protein